MYLDNQIIYEDMQYIYTQPIEWNKLKNKRVFISGAYGMLSSYIVFFLMYLNIYHDIGIHVIAQGRNRDKAYKRFSEFWENDFFEFTNLNICETINYPNKIDYFIHSAGVANPRLYSTSPVEVIEPNVLGTYYLLDFARNKGCDKCHLYSTGDVYGKADNPSDIKEDSLGKMDPLDIHSCYGESKRLAETLCAAFSREYHVPITITRIGHTYGPTMDIQNDPRSFSSFMRCAVEEKDIVMYSAGMAKRPFCYLADAVYGYMLMLLRGEDGEAYNISNSNSFISIAELAQIIADVSGNRIKIVKKQRTDSFVENALNVCNRLAEDKLISLGWHCNYDVYQGMMRTYSFFKSNMI